MSLVIIAVATALTAGNEDLLYNVFDLDRIDDHELFFYYTNIVMEIYLTTEKQLEVIMGRRWHETYLLHGVDEVRNGYLYSFGPYERR